MNNHLADEVSKSSIPWVRIEDTLIKANLAYIVRTDWGYTHIATWDVDNNSFRDQDRDAWYLGVTHIAEISEPEV